MILWEALLWMRPLPEIAIVSAVFMTVFLVRNWRTL